MRRLLISGVMLLGLAIPPVVQGQAAPHCPPGQQPEFVLGFKTLSDALGEVMGQPVECEHPDPRTGDSLQQTTTGLAFYRRSTNTPTFTNGWEHWALTAEGLVYWTGDSIDPPAAAVTSVAFAGDDIDVTRAFVLQEGPFTIDWQARSVDGAPCFFGGLVQPQISGTSFETFGDVIVPAGETRDLVKEGYIYEAGRYQLAVVTSCAWRVNISPARPA